MVEGGKMSGGSGDLPVAVGCSNGLVPPFSCNSAGENEREERGEDMAAIWWCFGYCFSNKTTRKWSGVVTVYGGRRCHRWWF